MNWPSGRYSRGFTLVELMVVVVIITGLTALAVPSIVRQMRDRRTRQTAEEIASIYRQARLRAMGRGAAVMVAYDTTTGFATSEGIVGSADNCSQLPVSSCSAAVWNPVSTWNTPATITRKVSVVDVIGNGDKSGGDANVQVCFTPMGRTQFRLAATAAFALMTGVPVVKVYSNDGGSLTRYVLIPPNGLARTDVAQ